MKKLAIGSDHGGYSLKEELKEILKDEIEFIDVGTNSLDSVDYPDFAKKVVNLILKGSVKEGILICGSGVGMSITANRYKGIRAALVDNIYEAQLAKEHNNANILVLRGRFTNSDFASKMVLKWLDSEFQGGRHLRRIEKIDK